MAGKDYYKILGVEKSATQEEIKKAFRKAAHEHHPDKGGDEAKFKEYNEAYQVLGDETKRQQYDQFGTTFDGAGGGGGFNGFSGFGQGMNFEDLGDIFGDMFGFGGGARGRTKKGQDIVVDVTLSFKDAIFGIEKEISLSKNKTCERCSGNGAEPGTKLKECGTCHGQGFETKAQRTMFGVVQTRVACSACGGNGEIPETACTECRGYGTSYGRETLRVSIPAGVEDGMKIRVRGGGEAVQGGEKGDLFLRLHVEGDKRFVREDLTIHSERTIGFTQAALGDEVLTDTIEGPVKLKIPAGTQSGDKLRLKNKGVPSNRGRGDHIVHIQVETPTKLSREQRRLIEELNLRKDG